MNQRSNEGEPQPLATGRLDPRNYTALIRLLSDPKHRVVVSFGGGSVPGLCGNAALAGILEELDLRQHVTEIWGTSAGAAIGGPWSTGSTAADLVQALKGLDRRGAVDISWVKLAFCILLKPLGCRLPDGLVKGRHFRDTVDSVLKTKTFEECLIPFRCVACTDDGQAQTKVFRKGLLLPAIQSSMSLPGIVVPRTPLPEEETGYYDGGLVEKTPLKSPIAEHRRRHDGRKLLLVATHFGNDAKCTPAHGFLNRFLHSIYALEGLAWGYQLAEARAEDNIKVMILNPHIEDPALFDFSRVETNYQHAHRSFADLLQNAKVALTFGLD